jgi:hypothetical protein
MNSFFGGRGSAGVAGALLSLTLAGMISGCQAGHVVTAAEAPQDYLARVNSGADSDCDPAIAKQVAALGVALDDFKTIRVYRDGVDMMFSGSSNSGPPQAYIAWIDLQSCKGDLALRFDRYCRPVSSFATDACQVPASKPAASGS